MSLATLNSYGWIFLNFGGLRLRVEFSRQCIDVKRVVGKATYG